MEFGDWIEGLEADKSITETQVKELLVKLGGCMDIDALSSVLHERGFEIVPDKQKWQIWQISYSECKFVVWQYFIDNLQISQINWRRKTQHKFWVIERVP